MKADLAEGLPGKQKKADEPSGKGLQAEMAEECTDCRRGQTNLGGKGLKALMAEGEGRIVEESWRACAEKG